MSPDSVSTTGQIIDEFVQNLSAELFWCELLASLTMGEPFGALCLPDFRPTSPSICVRKIDAAELSFRVQVQHVEGPLHQGRLRFVDSHRSRDLRLEAFAATPSEIEMPPLRLYMT